MRKCDGWTYLANTRAPIRVILARSESADFGPTMNYGKIWHGESNRAATFGVVHPS